MWMWVVLGVFVALLVVGALSRRGSIYKRLYSEAHFLELAAGLAKARREALANMGRGLDPREQQPPGMFLTSAGLAVVYTIDRDAKGILHYLSLSHRGGWFAETAARLLAAYIARVLGLEIARFNLGLSSGGRYHMAAMLDEAEHAAFLAREPLAPTRETLPELLGAAGIQGRGLRFQPFDLPVK